MSAYHLLLLGVACPIVASALLLAVLCRPVRRERFPAFDEYRSERPLYVPEEWVR